MPASRSISTAPPVANFVSVAIGSEQVDRFERMAGETALVGLNRVRQILPEMNLPALQHAADVRPSDRLRQLHLHVADSAAHSGAGNPQACFR